MKLLLDTHAFLWLLNDDYASLRGKAAVDLFLADDSMPFLSLASVWEMAIKIRLGKFDLQQPLAEFIPQQLERNQIELLPIGLGHIVQTMALPFHHRDPFDRLLIAQAMVEDMTLLSSDTAFDEYDVKRVWKSL
ncbi:MAG: type II toxin-antitoxin system VapC family toxin [Candidatus Methylumidiphilus sp.]